VKLRKKGLTYLQVTRLLPLTGTILTLAVLIPLVLLVFSLASSISYGEITTAAKAP